MLRQALVAALFAINFTNGFFTTSLNEDTEAGAPGALQIFLNVKSMNTLLQDVAVFAPYYVLQGKSWSPYLDLSVPELDLDIKVNQLNITNVIVGHSAMEFVGDTDTVRTTLSEVNITLAVDAKATSFVPVPLEITELFLQNVSIQLELATTSKDELIW